MKQENIDNIFSHCHPKGDTQVQIKVTHTFLKAGRQKQCHAGLQNMPRDM